MSDTPAPHRARTAAQLHCHGEIRHEPRFVVHATGATDTALLENWFYGCCVPHLYNEERPHSSLGYKTPKEFAAAQAANFYRAELGQEASNAGPLPQTPIPAQTGDRAVVTCRILT
jgi:hypothetical protein